MTISLILLTFALTSYLYFGLYVLLLDPGSAKYRSFFYVCISFFLWSISYLLLNIFSGTNYYILFSKSAYIIRIIYVPLTLRFFLILTGYYYNIKRRSLFNIAIWIVPFFFVLHHVFSKFLDFYFITGFWNISEHIIANLYNLTGLLFLFKWGRVSRFKREKKQSRLIIIGALITIIITVISDYTADIYKYPSLTPFLILLWIGCIFYTMVKYQFLAFIPAYINQNIINNINELIIVLDDKKNIFYVNNKTKSIIKEDNIKKKDLSVMLFEYFRINIEIDKLMEGKYKTFSCRINFLRNKKEKILVDTIFSTITDKFGDILGILIMGNEIKGLKQLEIFYKTTDRESEIIQELAEGFTNTKIANQLGISENTLKRHIANIYAKLGINNKVELLNLLKDFNLIPNYKAEKTLLILNKE